MYQYTRGKGWVFQDNVLKVYEEIHEGRRYRVTIFKHGLAEGEAGRTTAVDDGLRWWDEFEGIPAGFGGGDFGPTRRLKVVTELIE